MGGAPEASATNRASGRQGVGPRGALRSRGLPGDGVLVRAATASAGATCGSTHTAAGVPVIIKVARGPVNCKTALQVENEYAARIKAGQVRGNGGGAPVVVSGWTCQGYDTPEVLSTGNASQCHTGSATILAVLPVAPPTTG